MWYDVYTVVRGKPLIADNLKTKGEDFIMSNIISGLDALNLLQGGGHENKFTYLKSGDRFNVKVRNMEDFIGVLTYGIFDKKINTFVPEKNPTLNKAGYPVSDLTPFDKAWQHHMDLSTEKQDEESKKASAYRVKPRFAIGFYDLDKEEDIVIDFSQNQAQQILGVIQRNELKLGKKAFELAKDGANQNTVVSMTPLDLEEPDLTQKQIDAFNNAPEEFDKEVFQDLYYTRNESEMVDALKTAGFDITAIGYGEQKSESVADANPMANAEDPTDNF